MNFCEAGTSQRSGGVFRDVETGKDNLVVTTVYNVIYVAGCSCYGDVGIVT